MKKLTILFLCLFMALQASAVLKEQNLEQTLKVLRAELTERHIELSQMSDQRKQQTRDIIQQLRETIKRSNQNALMLCSQQQNYVFDLTYACHEATDQFQQFTRHSAPLRKYMEKNNAEHQA
jgi:G:T/U-mismatch repair DNA glycosylase